MEKPKWTDIVSCFLALAAALLSGLAVLFAWNANAISEKSNAIAEHANQLTTALNRRNEEFGKYLLKLEQQITEQAKQPNLVVLSSDMRALTSSSSSNVLTVVLQNNGERVATILKMGFSPFDPMKIGAMPQNFNKTPIALKVPEVTRDLRMHDWKREHIERELFLIPAGEVVSLKIALPKSLGKGIFYLVYSGEQAVVVAQME